MSIDEEKMNNMAVKIAIRMKKMAPEIYEMFKGREEKILDIMATLNREMIVQAIKVETGNSKLTKRELIDLVKEVSLEAHDLINRRLKGKDVGPGMQLAVVSVLGMSGYGSASVMLTDDEDDQEEDWWNVSDDEQEEWWK